MKIFERTAKLFGIISVSERNDTVRITGLDGMILKKYISKMWQSDVLTKMMFTSVTDTSITLQSFFIPDLIYILNKLKEEGNISWAGRRTIDKIKHGIETNTWWKKTLLPVESMVDRKRLSLFKYTPLSHQSEFIDFYGETLPRYGLRCMLLPGRPGSGKTLTALMISVAVIPPSIAEVKIIISPKKALHEVWEKSILTLFKKHPTYWVCDSNRTMPLSKCEYYVFNYEKLDDAIKLGEFLTSKGIRFFVGVDESHNFADFRSSRTQKLVKLQNISNNIYGIWMSGSPILRRGSELVSFLKCSDPLFTPEAERRFSRIYSASPGKAGEIFYHRLGLMMAYFAKQYGNQNRPPPKIVELPVKLPKSLENKFLLSTIREDMKKFMKDRIDFHMRNIKQYRKTINDAFDVHRETLTTRAERIQFDRYLRNLKIVSQNPDIVIRELNDEIRKYERRKLLPSLPPTSRKEFRSALSAVKNIKLKVRGEALGSVLSRRRAECAAALGVYCKPEEIIKDSKSKTLFFASSILPIKALEIDLRKKGFHPLLVYAETNKNLSQIINEFDNNPDANPICATMQSLSEAVPVTAASTVVLLNRPFRQATFDQVVARADRIGQKYPVTVIETVLDTGSEPNVSSRTDEILQNVREDINILLGSDFAGPDPDEREYKALIDSSKESDYLLRQDELLGIL